ncbi:uncharacterized protein METZ01_LOCUS144703 [marine metagenome]|uniref:Uncharacterized protein n=1 Tax=marine metagenome TaxID=408172 RepID=A0A381ZRL3_9ZZZZ
MVTIKISVLYQVSSFGKDFKPKYILLVYFEFS